MRYKLIVFVALFVGAGSFPCVSTASENLGRQAYIDKNALVIWDSNMGKRVTVATDVVSKNAPRWSSDGKSILTWTVKYEKSLVASVLMTTYSVEARPREPKTLRVDYMFDGSVRLPDVREIRTVGWLGSHEIYLVGNIGPNADELRIFDLATGVEEIGSEGYGFYVCELAKKIYSYQHSGQKSGYELMANDTPLRLQPRTKFRLLASDSACKSLYGLSYEDDKSVLTHLDETGNSLGDIPLPNSDYVRMTYFRNAMLLERASGTVDVVDMIGRRAFDGSQENLKWQVFRRHSRSIDVSPLYDWYPK